MAEASDVHVVVAVPWNQGDHLIDHGAVVVRIVACEGHDLVESKSKMQVLL